MSLLNRYVVIRCHAMMKMSTNRNNKVDLWTHIHSPCCYLLDFQSLCVCIRYWRSLVQDFLTIEFRFFFHSVHQLCNNVIYVCSIFCSSFAWITFINAKRHSNCDSITRDSRKDECDNFVIEYSCWLFLNDSQYSWAVAWSKISATN